MSLVDKLFKSRKYGQIEHILDQPMPFTWKGRGVVGYESDVADLVREIEEKAEGRGLTLSRWETSSPRSGWIKTITWAVHTGQRPDASTRLPDSAHIITLHGVEGTTKRCEAYRKLSELLNAF